MPRSGMMDRNALQSLTKADLARLLAGSRRHSDQWREVRSECLRRAERWGRVADCATWGLLGCLALVALALLRS
jgi:hypothetical protein